MRVKKVRRTHAHTNILIIISPLKYWHTLQFLSNYYPFSTSYVSFLLLDQICSLMLQHSHVLPGPISFWYIKWLPDSKFLYISISYRLLCGFFKRFTSWLFVGPFETDETLGSRGRASFNQREIEVFWAAPIPMEIASTFVFKRRWQTVVPEMWCRSRYSGSE